MGRDLEAGRAVGALRSITQLPPLRQGVGRDLVEPPLLTKQPFPFR
jgi:hypothetical protein